jgi:hypothetical protein
MKELRGQEVMALKKIVKRIIFKKIFLFILISNDILYNKINKIIIFFKN